MSAKAKTPPTGYIKPILNLATPIVLVRILFMSINIVGMILISRLGHLQLSAGALITALLNTLLTVGMSPLLAISIMAGRAHGSNKSIEVGNIINVGFAIAAALAFIIILILYSLGPLLFVLHQPQSLIPLVANYAKVFAIGVLPSLLITNAHQLCFATKRPRYVTYWSICTLVLILPIGTSLMYGLFGMPHLGMIGWAWGIVISNWVMAIAIFAYLISTSEFKAYNLFNFSGFSWEIIKSALHIGTPITLQFLSELLVFALINLIIGLLGVTILGAQQIILQCMLIVLMVPMGIAQASSILISQVIGQDNRDASKHIVFSSISLTLLCILIVLCGYIFAPQQIINIYLPKGNFPKWFSELVVLNLFIAGISQLGDAIRNVAIGCLRGFRDVWFPMYSNSIILFAALPIAYLVGVYLKHGLTAITITYMFAYWISGAVVCYRLATKHLALKLPSYSLKVA